MVSTETRLIIFFAAKAREALYNQQKTRPGADSGSDHELLIAKFRLKLEKVEKTTRPFKKAIHLEHYRTAGDYSDHRIQFLYFTHEKSKLLGKKK